MIINHIKSIFKGKWDKKRMINAFAIYRARTARGGFIYGYIYGMVTWVIALKVYNISLFWAIPIFFLKEITQYLIGFYDQKQLKLWQCENEISSVYVNPFDQRIERRLSRIENKLNTETKEDKEAMLNARR